MLKKKQVCVTLTTKRRGGPLLGNKTKSEASYRKRSASHRGQRQKEIDTYTGNNRKAKALPKGKREDEDTT